MTFRPALPVCVTALCHSFSYSAVLLCRRSEDMRLSLTANYVTRICPSLRTNVRLSLTANYVTRICPSLQTHMRLSLTANHVTRICPSLQTRMRLSLTANYVACIFPHCRHVRAALV